MSSEISNELENHPGRLSEDEIYAIAEKYQADIYGYIPSGFIMPFIREIIDTMNENKDA